MSASDSCVDFAIRRRCSPTRRVRSTKSGISAKANSASSQLSRIMPTIVASTVVTLATIDVAVLVTTPCTPPMSLEMRDWTSPVRVRVKNASDSRCRCRKTAARRSCITRWPTWFESSVCHTPRMPLTIAITIMPAANSEICLEFCVLDRLQEVAEQEGRHDSERRRDEDQREHHAEPAPVRAEQPCDPLQVRAAHRRVGRPVGRFLVAAVPSLRTRPHGRERRYARAVQRVCVFCGASSGRLPAYAEAARAFGAAAAAARDRCRLRRRPGRA